MFEATQSSQEWRLSTLADEQIDAEVQADMFADLMLYQAPYWAKGQAQGEGQGEVSERPASQDDAPSGPPPLCVIAEML